MLQHTDVSHPPVPSVPVQCRVHSIVVHASLGSLMRSAHVWYRTRVGRWTEGRRWTAGSRTVTWRALQWPFQRQQHSATQSWVSSVLQTIGCVQHDGSPRCKECLQCRLRVHTGWARSGRRCKERLQREPSVRIRPFAAEHNIEPLRLQASPVKRTTIQL